MVNSRGPMSDWVGYLPIEAIEMLTVDYAVGSLLGCWMG